MSDALDLDGYLARIAYHGPRRATRAVLEALHAHHVAAIPFENADVRLGRPIRLELAALEEKLVRARRGGYCFEQNALFAAVLGALGFEVEMLEARVRPAGAAAVLPRTHMVLAVRLGAGRWLADVGFGGDGPLLPVPWSGALSRQTVGAYRLERDGPLRVLRLRRHRAWEDLYAFGPEPALPVDYAVANHFTSTHASSPFVRVLTVQLSTPEARHVLRGRTYAVRRALGEVVRELEADEVVALVRGRFGLGLSRAEVLAALG
jgi:N-hydroxyarylamine O-acetyltransferase